MRRQSIFDSKNVLSLSFELNRLGHWLLTKLAGFKGSRQLSFGSCTWCWSAGAAAWPRWPRSWSSRSPSPLQAQHGGRVVEPERSRFGVRRSRPEIKKWLFFIHIVLTFWKLQLGGSMVGLLPSIITSSTPVPAKKTFKCCRFELKRPERKRWPALMWSFSELGPVLKNLTGSQSNTCKFLNNISILILRKTKLPKIST